MKYISLVILSFVVLVSLPASAFFVSDGEFVPGTWTAEFFTVGALQGGDTISAVTDRFIGPDGAFMLHQYSVDIGANQFYRAYAPVFLDAFVYDPGTQGAIQSIAASITTLNVAAPPPGDPASTFPVLFIKQGGEYYVESINQVTIDLGDPDTIHTKTDIAADDFAHINPNAFIDFNTHPDFSGGPMQFGFAQMIIPWDLDDPIGPTTLVAGFDDVSVRITEVPEPGTMVLLGSGVLLLLPRRRRS